MRISMVDEKTYLVGDKEFAVGDEVSLDGIQYGHRVVQFVEDVLDVLLNRIDDVSLPTSDTIKASDLNHYLINLVKHMKDLKATIVDDCRRSNDAWTEIMRVHAFDYETHESTLGHGTALLFHAIQRHLDAPLPLRRNIDTGVITVAARAENYPLNYTKSWATTKFKIATLDLLATFAGDTGSLSSATHDLNHELKSSVIGPMAPYPIGSATDVAQTLMNKAKSVYDSSSKMPTPLIVYWVSEKGQFVFAPSGTTLSEPKLIPKALGKALHAAVIDFRSCGTQAPGIYVLANVDGKAAALGVAVTEKGLVDAAAADAPIVAGIDALLKGLMKE